MIRKDGLAIVSASDDAPDPYEDIEFDPIVPLVWAAWWGIPYREFFGSWLDVEYPHPPCGTIRRWSLSAHKVRGWSIDDLLEHLRIRENLRACYTCAMRKLAHHES